MKNLLVILQKRPIFPSDGKYEQRMAEVYVNLEKYEDAADAARKALDKGSLDFESNAFMLH